MKKFTKIMLLIAGVTACLGAICMVVAFAMGLTTDGLKQMVRDGKFAFDMKEATILKITDDDADDMNADTGEILNENIKVEINGEERIYTTSDAFTNIDVEFGAGILNIYYDDVDEIEIREKNIDGFEVEVKNNTLKIRNDLDVTVSDVDDLNNRSLAIAIPTGMTFDGVDLKVGAAQADINGITAKAVDVVIGAGQANISNIRTEIMGMEVGAGEATVSNLDIDTLDLEVGMGQVNLGMSGAQTDYNYNVECGMGNVVVGQHSYGGLGAEHHSQNHHATKEINVECGMGEVHVKFMQ